MMLGLGELKLEAKDEAGVEGTLSAGPVEASAKVVAEVSAITSVNPGTSGAVAASGTGYKNDS
jgi:hypothetical protein